jgi:serine/threonine-protein kinase
MGEVYRARDTRLNREVAVKVLPPGFEGDSDRTHRFRQEARTIAALSHPHICQIHDVGPGYLVLEYIDGAPARGPMPAEQAVRLALQVAGAIEAAHAHGILHRDLKPANILVTKTGDAKLLDFGLAKLMTVDADVTRTTPGAVMGTPSYMSPEQAQGKPLDARSDVFSFGAVFYELIGGERAFDGNDSATVLAAVLRDIPRPLQAPPALVRIIERCLTKAPDERYQTMVEVKSALQQLSGRAGVVRASIAVLPFANLSADRDNEYFSDGLAEEIINALAQVSGLKVIARTSAFAFKGQNTDIRRIAETLGVAHVLEGSVRKAGQRIRVTAQLIAADDGSHLWSERYDRELADVFAIQDDIASAIAAALRVKLAPTGARRYTPKLAAYEAFLRGRHHLFKFTPDSWARGIGALEQAIALDPQYAQPHVELGLSYLLSATNGLRPFRETVDLIRQEAQAALDLDPSEPAPHFLFGSIAAVHDYDWREAETRFRRALSTASASPDVHWAYASFYLLPLGRLQESVAEMQREVDLDPLNISWRAVLSSHLNHAERYEEAIENAQKALAIDEAHWVPMTILSQSYAYQQRWDEAIAVAEKAHRAAPWNANVAGILAGSLACAGEKARAEEIMRQLGDRPLPLWGRVEYHLLRSELDAAADWYEKAIAERDPFAVVFVNSPLVRRRLSASTRWPRLAALMNLPNPDEPASTGLSQPNAGQVTK